MTSAQGIAASGTAGGLPGDNTNALAVVNFINGHITALDSDTLANFYERLVAQVGSHSQAASDELNVCG